MAGFYPDVPAPRMAYDRDGSVGFWLGHPGTGGPANVFTQSELNGMNSEAAGGVPFSSWNTMSLGVIFPQLRDITGVCLQGLNGYANDWGLNSISTSVDTTNGVDGTWVIRSGVTASYAPENPKYRQNISVVSWAGVKAVRWMVSSNSGGNRSAVAHLYGSITSGQTPDRLRLWHPTLDEALDDNTSADGAYFDWGDVVRGTSQDRTFRIKNNSATLTANSIALSIHVPTDTVPTVASQMTLSDGGSFSGSINIGNLSPNTISGVITLRRTILSNAILSVANGRILINPGSWT